MLENQNAASQYGAIYFTHNQHSLVSHTDGTNSILTNQTYNDLVLQTCREKAKNTSSYLNCSIYEGLGYVVGVNFTAPHGSLLFQSLADQSIVRSALNDDEYEIRTTVHPLPLTMTEKGYKTSQDSFTAW